jgi:membrane associated rhomboid family serine protease
MFQEFSTHFFRALSAREFTLIGDEGQPLDTAVYWAAQKIIDASLCVVHTLDCTHASPERLLPYRERYLAQFNKMRSRFRTIWVVYVLVANGNSPAAEGSFSSGNNPAAESLSSLAEPYDGQPVYEIFWTLRRDTGEAVIKKGQPSDLFGLRSDIRRSIKNCIGQTDTADNFAVNGAIYPAPGSPETPRPAPATFREAARQTAEASPFRPVRDNAVCVYIIAVINALVLFFFMDGLDFDYLSAVQYGAIVPVYIVNGHQYYRLVSAMFVHFGWQHLVMNMFGLFIFGTRVERYFGRVRFLLVYFLSGVSGSVFSLLFTRGNAAGASGAVYGLTGAVFAFALISRRAMDRLTGYTMLLYAGIGLAMGFMMPGIDNFGHIGGWLAGAAAGAIITHKRHSN